MDQVCNKNTVGCFEKIHKASELQASWSSPQIQTADFTTVSKEPARAFTPFKKPLKPTPTSDLVGRDLQQLAATSSVEGNGHPECNVSDPPLVNGPSTPMRYVPRPKNASAEMSGTGDPFSLSLATGLSSSEMRELEQKENFTESNRVGVPKGLTYYRHHPMKPNQLALSSSKNSQRRIVPELRQEGVEPHKENLLSLSLAKPESMKPLVHKPSESDYHKTFGTIARTKASISEGIDMRHQNFHEQVSSQIINSVDCSSDSMADDLQSSQNIPSACVPGQPLTCTFSALLSGSTPQENIFTLQNNVPELGTSTPAGRTSQQLTTFNTPKESQQPTTFNTLKESQRPTNFNTPKESQRPTTFNTPKESLNCIPILQTPFMPNGEGHRLVNNEGNMYLHCSDYSISGKKRKSLSYTKQEADSAGMLTSEKGSDNSCKEERFSQKRQEAEHINSPKHDSVNRDSSKKHIIFNGNVETEFAGTEKGVSRPVSLELHHNNAINYSLGSMGYQVSSIPDMNRLFELKLGNMPTTSSSGATEALPNQSINTENNIVISSMNGHKGRSLGSGLLTFPAYSPMPTTLSTFSSGDPSLPQALVDTSKRGNSHAGDSKATQQMSPIDNNWGDFLALSTAEVEQSKKEALVPYQQRFINLQAFLKQCDEPNDDHLRIIRSLSASGRSGHAVNLETRAIMLSLEEVKELRRMKMLNVFGKGIPKGLNDAGATPQGPRLPAPGAAQTLKLVTGS